MPIQHDPLESALENFLDEVAHSRNVLQPSYPERLFHYTTSTGMLGILSSARLWATHVRFLNDASELKYGIEVLESVIDDRIMTEEDLVVTVFLDYARTKVNSVGDSFDCYVTCFCTRDDLLNHWHTYGGAGAGYALGFNTSEIGVCTRPDSRAQEFTLRQVIYNPEEQRRQLSNVLNRIIEILTNSTKGLAIEDVTPVIKRCNTFLQQVAAEFLLFFKNPAYESENEWRLCRLMLRDFESQVEEGKRVLFREGPYGLTPYVELDISSVAGLNRNKLPLAKITHGKVPDAGNLHFALDKLLRGKGYSQVEIKPSTLPIRR